MNRLGRWASLSRGMVSIGCVAGSLVCVVEGRALASDGASTTEGAPAKKLVVHVEGKNAAAIADQITAAGPDGIEILDPTEFDKALRQGGLPTALGAAIQNKFTRKSIQRNLNKAMAKVGADALVLARETFVGKSHDLYVVFYVKDAEVAEVDENVNLGNSDAAQRKAIKNALEESLKPLAPPPPKVIDADAGGNAGEGEGEAEKPEKEKTDSPFRSGIAGYELAAGRLGFQDGGRWFKYSDPISANNTRPYAVFGPPALNLAGEIYPGATSGITGVRDIGVTFDYTHHFALKSKTSQNPDGSESAEFDGTWNRLDLGLRYRLRFGEDAQPIVLGLSAAYGFHNFVFLPANAAAELIKLEVPTVRYKYVRVGADAWLPFGMFAVIPRFSYLAPLGGSAPADRIPGPQLGGAIAPEPIDDTVYARFRGASVKGIALGIDASVALGSGIEVRAGFDYTRFFSSFAPEVGDAFVAGGALDETLELRLLGGYRY